MARDGQGRIVAATVYTTGGSHSAFVKYGGLGAVVAAQGVNPGTGLEEMDVDAIGNRYWQRVNGPIANNSDRNRRSSYATSARLDSIWTHASDAKPFTSYDYRQRFSYDGSNNVQRTYGFEIVQCGGLCVVDDESVSYYGADEKLRVFNRQIGQGTSGPGGVYEEYRYDALGRRVMVRSRSTATCTTTGCDSYIERVAWDGDQVIMEVRAPGRDGTTHTVLNSDYESGQATDGYLHGRVRYTHAGGIDKPVTVIRQNMAGHPTITVAPHANWQGDFEVGTFMNGALTTTCSGSYGCPLITWPGQTTTADGEPISTSAPPSWFGGLLRQKADHSGLQYMRNRYYDPRTGRFTQEDPIGLAGGLNLFGFAGGDPITYTDPFGLNPCLTGPSAYDCIRQAGLAAMASVAEGINHIGTGLREATLAVLPIPGSRIRAGRTLARVGAKLDNLLPVTNRTHLSAAAAELRGAATGFDHVTEVRNAMNGLRTQIHTLNGVLGNPSLTEADRLLAEQMLGRASRALDAAESVFARAK